MINSGEVQMWREAFFNFICLDVSCTKFKNGIMNYNFPHIFPFFFIYNISLISCCVITTSSRQLIITYKVVVSTVLSEFVLN